MEGEETHTSCPLGSAPQDPLPLPQSEARGPPRQGPLHYPLKLAHRHFMSSELGNWHPTPPSQPRDHDPFSPPLSNLTPSPAVETLTQASKTSSRVCTSQEEERRRAWQGEQWGPCQPPPVPQFPGSS